MNVSLLIPVYPPDYNYIYRLLRKMNKHHIEIDIYLIFSSSDDYKLFKVGSRFGGPSYWPWVGHCPSANSGRWPLWP